MGSYLEQRTTLSTEPADRPIQPQPFYPLQLLSLLSPFTPTHLPHPFFVTFMDLHLNHLNKPLRKVLPCSLKTLLCCSFSVVSFQQYLQALFLILQPLALCKKMRFEPFRGPKNDRKRLPNWVQSSEDLNPAARNAPGPSHLVPPLESSPDTVHIHRLQKVQWTNEAHIHLDLSNTSGSSKYQRQLLKREATLGIDQEANKCFQQTILDT